MSGATQAFHPAVSFDGREALRVRAKESVGVLLAQCTMRLAKPRYASAEEWLSDCTNSLRSYLESSLSWTSENVCGITAAIIDPIEQRQHGIITSSLRGYDHLDSRSGFQQQAVSWLKSDHLRCQQKHHAQGRDSIHAHLIVWPNDHSILSSADYEQWRSRYNLGGYLRYSHPVAGVGTIWLLVIQMDLACYKLSVPNTTFDRLCEFLCVVSEAYSSALAHTYIRRQSIVNCLNHNARLAVPLLIAGYTEAEIARYMGRSVGTVHDWVKMIYKQLGVSSRLELAQLWYVSDEAASRPPQNRSDVS